MERPRCYCEGNTDGMSKSAEEAAQRITELKAKLEAEQAEKAPQGETQWVLVGLLYTRCHLQTHDLVLRIRLSESPGSLKARSPPYASSSTPWAP